MPTTQPTTLAHTLDRIPEAFRLRITEVFVCDDASQDRTYRVGLEYQQTQFDLPISVIQHEHKLGYDGNQKAGYSWPSSIDLDIIVLLHARRPVRARVPAGHRRPARAGRGRRGLRLPDDGQGIGASWRHAGL